MDKLDNSSLLILEGHNNVLDWHAYLMYEKRRNDNFLKHPDLRNVVFLIRQNYKRNIVEKSLWLVPMEILKI